MLAVNTNTLIKAVPDSSIHVNHCKLESRWRNRFSTYGVLKCEVQLYHVVVEKVHRPESIVCLAILERILSQI
jgi:hypothetical protein